MSSPLLTTTAPGYYAEVRMHLAVGARTLVVAQTGPDFVILEKPLDLSATRAELVLQLNAAEERVQMFLRDGIRSSDERTRIALA